MFEYTFGIQIKLDRPLHYIELNLTLLNSNKILENTWNVVQDLMKIASQLLQANEIWSTHRKTKTNKQTTRVNVLSIWCDFIEMWYNTTPYARIIVNANFLRRKYFCRQMCFSFSFSYSVPYSSYFKWFNISMEGQKCTSSKITIKKKQTSIKRHTMCRNHDIFFLFLVSCLLIQGHLVSLQEYRVQKNAKSYEIFHDSWNNAKKETLKQCEQMACKEKESEKGKIARDYLTFQLNRNVKCYTAKCVNNKPYIKKKHIHAYSFRV